MMQFPHSQKDDILDSLAYHLQLKEAGSPMIAPQTIPVNSPAWIERQQFDLDVRENGRLPRWRRQPVEGLAFS